MTVHVADTSSREVGRGAAPAGNGSVRRSPARPHRPPSLKVLRLAAAVIAAEIATMVALRVFGPQEAIPRLLLDAAVTTTLVIVLMYILVFRPFSRHLGERERFEASLQDSNADLEAVVADRTAALRGSEERYRTLIEFAPDAIVVHRGGEIAYANPAAFSLYGAASADQLIGRRILDLVHPDDRPLAAERMEVVRAAGVTPLRRMRIIRADGSLADVESTTVAIQYRGAPAVLAMVRDVSERQRAEERLREVVQRLSYHVDHSPLAVIEWGPDMRLIRWAGEAERIFGWKAEEVLGKRMEDFRWVYQEDVAHVADVTSDLVTGSNPRRVSANRNYRKDGSVASCEWYNSSLYDQSGKLLSILSLVLDVTAREEAVEALRKATDHLDSLLTYASAPIVVWDPEQRITRFNGAFERLTGRRAEDVIGDRLDLLFPEGSRSELLAQIRRGAAGERWEAAEIPIAHLDGSVRTVLWNSAAIVAADGATVIATIAQGQDITELKRGEEERERLLAEARERAAEMEAILAAQNDAVLTWDEGTTVRRANPFFLATYGFDPVGLELKEVVSRVSCRNLDGRPLVPEEQPTARAVRGQASSGVPFRINRGDGAEAVVEVSSGPMRVGERIAGAVTVWHDVTPRVRGEEELAAALAQARRRTEEISALLTASRAVLEQRSFRLAAKAIFDSCKTLMGAAAGFVALSAPGESTYDLVYFDPGELRCTVDVHLPMPIRGLRAEAYRTRRPVVANDFASSPWKELLPPGHVGLDNVLVAPLVVGDEVMGVLGLSNRPGGFGDNEIRLASAFAEMASVALLNSRAVELSKRNQEVLESLVDERTTQLRGVNESLRDEVAERQLRESQLRLSEHRFRDLFENVFDGVYEADTERHFRSVNSALVGMLGYGSKEELIRALEAEEIWTDRNEVEALWRKLTSAGSLRGTEVALRHRAGSVVRGLINVNAVRDESGMVVAYQGTVSDITALKRAEEALEAERAQLESVLTAMQDSVFIIGADHTIEYLNPAARRQFGEIDRHPCHVVLEGGGEPCGWCNAEAVSAGGEMSWEWTARRTGKTFEGFATRLRNADGSYSRLEILHDVSGRKEAENALNAERARLFGVLDQLPLFVYLRKADGAVVFANRFFVEKFGRPEGRRCFEILGRDQAPCVGCDFDRSFADGEKVEWEWTAPGGESYQVHHYPFVESDASRLVLALGIDVTERKRAYEAEQVARRTADTLREASLGLTRTLDVDTVLVSLVDHLRRLVPFDRAKVMLLHPDGRMAVRAVLDANGRTQLPAEPRPSFLPFDNPVVHSIITTRAAMLIPDIHEPPAFGVAVDPAFEHSWLGVPLVARGRVIGMYSLARRDPGSFTPEHQRLAEALSAQAAVAVENALLFEQVQSSRVQMQALSRRLVEVQETERRTIARELHDEAGQSLTSILFGLSLLERDLVEDEGARSRLAELKRTTDAVMEDLHRLAADLRPASLEHLGLVPALRQHLARIETTSGLTVRFMALGIEEVRLPRAVEATLFRIVQEALTNVLRHAHATRVDLLAERRGDRVVVVVEDDGVGFDAEATEFPDRFGCVGMKERAEALGGTFTIESAPRAGTTVVVEVPCADSSSAR